MRKYASLAVCTFVALTAACGTLPSEPEPDASGIGPPPPGSLAEPVPEGFFHRVGDWFGGEHWYKSPNFWIAGVGGTVGVGTIFKTLFQGRSDGCDSGCNQGGGAACPIGSNALICSNYSNNRRTRHEFSIQISRPVGGP
jgi:hypothetical protein